MMGRGYICNSDILAKDNSKILRGLGITAIMLHNFLTVPQFGLSRCNEMSFSMERSMAFFETLGNGHTVAELFAFLGWMGVPVFVFLTGYGIAFYPPPYTLSERVDFLKKKWLKLFLLLFPMLAVFGIQDILQHDFQTFAKRLFYPTFMVNFAYPWLRAVPGVYWYFSLTFQLYLLWAFAGRWFNKHRLVWVSLLMIAGLYLLCLFELPKMTSIYKHCFTGWFFVFATGVYMSVYKDNYISKLTTTWWHEALLSLFFFFLMIVMYLSLESWLIVPLAALFFFIATGKLVMRVGLFRRVFLWMGNYSAFIFVCHPLAKSVVSKIGFRYTDNMMLLILSYVILAILLSVIYMKLNRYLNDFFCKK